MLHYELSFKNMVLPVSKSQAVAALAGLVFTVFLSAASLQLSADELTVKQIVDEVRSHSFHPLNKDNSFTNDRVLGKNGVADLDDTDWKVRLLAISNLTKVQKESVLEIIAGLQDDNQHVRQICAAALGIRKETASAGALEEVLRNDESVLVRSQAAMSLGQIESKDSLPLLRDKQQNDPSRDVTHQCELAVDQIEKKKGATPELLAAFQNLKPENFETVTVGKLALDFTLSGVDGKTWTLSEFQKNKQWVVLIWVFADWCPVCHSEFRDLIAMKDEFQQEKIQVFTVEAHDTYRSRVMVGKELAPQYWFSKEPFQEAYMQKIWWNHLMDRAGAVAAAYSADPMTFTVHAEYINRPTTVIIDPDGIVRFLYPGTFWGDRPTIHETVEMIRQQKFDFVNPKRLMVSEK